MGLIFWLIMHAFRHERRAPAKIETEMRAKIDLRRLSRSDG
ncbi:hypothetical protein EDD25_0524 [Cryobacterium psychrophilum]|nr:hypothetical protein EDD25_0524 [Cryobacterium psychrophilum]